MKCVEMVWLSQTDLTNLNSGEGGTNFIDVKKYKKNGVEYPYVSGQAMRYYIKESIRRGLDKEYMCVPNDKGETCGEVKKCVGCDLFGYMLPKKGKGASVRVSPVKVSPAIGLLPFNENSVMDFLTRKHISSEKQEGDIVNVEIGVNLYKCGIAIDIVKIGGEEKIDEKKRTVKVEYLVNDTERKKRVLRLVEAIRYLSDYSKQARLLTDFTPDIILIAFQNAYSHRLQKAFKLNDEGIDLKRIEAVVNDIKEYTPKIIAGILPGVIRNESEVKSKLQELKVEVMSTHDAIKEALKYIKQTL